MAEKIKFKISLKELTFEYEGSRETGQAIQQRLSNTLGGIVDAQRVILAPPTDAPPAPQLPFGEPPEEAAKAAPANGNGHAAGEKPAKRTRKNGGPSLASIVTDLKESGYFSEPRTIAAITAKLKEAKGRNPGTALSGCLQKLIKEEILFRKDLGEGYVYKDTDFDESPRTEDASGKSAE